MKQISLLELKQREYNATKISNFRLIDGTCCLCGCNFTYSSVKHFLRNRVKYPQKINLWDTCQTCWLSEQTSNSPEWLNKNREAQLVAQNRPEQKIKNAAAVSKSWTPERRRCTSLYLKQRWLQDEFRDIALKNLSWTQDPSLYPKMVKKSLGSGGLKGEYNGIHYDSALELSYILWCQDNNINIIRYNRDPIDYIDEHNKPRKYFPDFIINDSTIVEIKGLGMFYKKNYLRNIKKIEYARIKYPKYIILLSSDECLKINYNRARKLHHETYKKINN